MKRISKDDDPNTHARAETTDLQHVNYESIKKLEERLKRVETGHTRIDRVQIDRVQLYFDKANEQISGLEDQIVELRDRDYIKKKTMDKHLDEKIKELEILLDKDDLSTYGSGMLNAYKDVKRQLR